MTRGSAAQGHDRCVEAVSGVLLSLWRAAAVFRTVSVLICAYLIIRWRDLYAHAGVAYGVGAAMLLVTGLVVWLATTGRAHRLLFVAADSVVCIALTLLSIAAQYPSQYHGSMPTLTTIWAAGPAIEAGLLLGTLGGVVAAALQFAASVIVREGHDGRTYANGALLLITGGIAGYVATLSVRAERERAAAEAERARLAERERLARSIHDGVLQVLGLLHRRGAAAGGEWADLAREAATQEAALRGLMTSEPRERAPSGRRNLSADLVELRSEQVTVSVPNTPVLLAAPTAREIVGAVHEALRNVEQHAGAEAAAWILVEELPDEVVITVRDDGVGIAPGRLDEAAAEGRLGVAKSIRGRIADLGGRIALHSAPGEGTEIEIVVPR
jgi:signal transduction histidine kinase